MGNEILDYPDVWIVPIKAGIEYMKAGNVTNDELLAREFEPFNCDEPVKTENCPGNVCQFTVDNEDIIGPIDYRMHVCPLSCPRNFPWLHNPMGCNSKSEEINKFGLEIISEYFKEV